MDGLGCISRHEIHIRFYDNEDHCYRIHLKDYIGFFDDNMDDMMEERYSIDELIF